MELDGNRLVWVTREGDKEVRYTSEPQTSFRKRFKVDVLAGCRSSGCSEHLPLPHFEIMRPFFASIIGVLLAAGIAWQAWTRKRRRKSTN